MALSGGLSFDFDTTQIRNMFRKMEDKDVYREYTGEIVKELANIMMDKAHVDTGEMRDSVYFLPASGGWKVIGEVGATSDHSIYEEGRGGYHAFMTNALEEYEHNVLENNLQSFVEELLANG